MRQAQAGRQGEGAGRRQAHKERKTGTGIKRGRQEIKWRQSHTKTDEQGETGKKKQRNTVKNLMQELWKQNVIYAGKSR